jgi:hypothetical protein
MPFTEEHIKRLYEIATGVSVAAIMTNDGMRDNAIKFVVDDLIRQLNELKNATDLRRKCRVECLSMVRDLITIMRIMDCEVIAWDVSLDQVTTGLNTLKKDGS